MPRPSKGPARDAPLPPCQSTIEERCRRLPLISTSVWSGANGDSTLTSGLGNSAIRLMSFKSGTPLILPCSSNSPESVSRHVATASSPYLIRNKFPCPSKHVMGNANAHPVPSLPYVLQNTRLSASATSLTYVSDVWYAGETNQKPTARNTRASRRTCARRCRTPASSASPAPP